METKIEVIEPKLFAGAVADEIVASIQESIADSGHCSLVLSGGSTPSTIYRSLSKPPRVEEVEWGLVSLFWGDERWVPSIDDQSNYKMAHETLLSVLPGSPSKVMPVDTSLGSPELAAQTYSDLIKKEVQLNAEGLPVFDLVLLGVGEDGHFASVFPNSSLLDDKDSKQICAAVQKPTDSVWRISMTPKAFMAAKHVLFIVRGESKADIIKRVLEGPSDPVNVPASLFVSAGRKVTWFLDSGAAQKLSK